LWKRGWQDNGMRLEHDPETSRRLIWCLLMRVLVEQTERSIQQWPGGLNVLGDGGQGKVESRDVVALGSRTLRPHCSGLFVCLDGRNPSVVHCPASRFSVQSFTRFADLRTAAAQAIPWNRASREQSES
jgi:hypothetical protein